MSTFFVLVVLWCWITGRSLGLALWFLLFDGGVRRVWAMRRLRRRRAASGSSRRFFS